MDAGEYRLGYRSDIEGLRAIAILLVVAAHASVPWLSGGFVGVDVFFVLSGYLITGLLLREIDQTGHLHFASFYARRFRRLLPALLLMLVCTCLVAIITLAPAAQNDQAIAGAAAAVWLSNIHFALSQLDYFGASATSNLFLHTWSLGVEEQFYLVWPALLALVLLKGPDKSTSISRLKLVMYVIAAGSFVVCFVLTRTSPRMAFYMMPLRAWQFATGALVWLHFARSSSKPVTTTPASRDSMTSYLLGWSGLVLVIASGVWFNANSAYPGWRALLPTAGAAMIIAAGMGATQRGVSRLLSWRPLQGIGRVSYSWYLWHWPVLLLGIKISNGDSLHRAALVLLSLLLATLSYRWIESPIRHQVCWTNRPGTTILTAVTLMVFASALCFRWSSATTVWTVSSGQARYSKAHGDTPLIYPMGCDDWYHSETVKACVFGSVDAKHTAVLMGDSILAQWFPAVAKIFHRQDWKLLVLTKSSCPMVDEPIFYARIGRMYTECGTWRRNALQQVASLNPDIVILGSVQTIDFDRLQWVEGTTRLLKTISANSGHIYILRGTPHLPFDGPDCLSSRNWLPWLHSPQEKCSASAYSLHDEEVYQWLQQASRGFDNVSTLDLSDAVCPGGVCIAERNGMVVFRDSQHLTATFVASLSDRLGKYIDLEQTAHARDANASKSSLQQRNP